MSCAHVYNSGELHEHQCPRTPLYDCADLNCGDPICIHHSTPCKVCGEEYFCPMHEDSKCGKAEA